MEFRFEKIQQQDITLLNISPMPDWQDFDDFVEYFLNQEKATLVAKDSGMDRHQVRYRVGAEGFILHFEHYSESVWIEPDF